MADTLSLETKPKTKISPANVLRIHNFRLLWIGEGISLLGDQFYLIAFSFTSLYPLTLVLAYGLDIGFMVQFTTINTLLQTLVEDSFRGRVMGLYILTSFAFAPFGNLLIGFLGEKLGMSMAMTLFAVCSLILSRLIFMKNPEIRNLS